MADRANPVWLLGAPFSGVCWLSGVLGCHPQLYVTPQLHLGLADDVGGLLDIFATSEDEHADGLLRTVAEIACGGQTDDGIAAARGWLEQRSALTIPALLTELASLVAPRRLVIPDAEAALRNHELQRLRGFAPQAQVVQVVRHPWTQGCLMAAWYVERLFVPVDYKDHSQDPPQVEPQAPWLRANLNLDSLAQQMPMLRLCIEALDRDFAGTAGTLCKWLDINADAATLKLLADFSRWPYAGPGPSAAPGGLEPDVLMDWPDGLAARAPTESLDLPLPWRTDGSGFAPEVLAHVRGYGY